MTSKFEGLPMVLLEAKTWGLPLLSFDIMTGPSEIIQNGVNGYLIPAYNMELFRKKIERLITDKELRMSFSNKSQIDMDKFELNNIMNKWYHVLGKYV